MKYRSVASKNSSVFASLAIVACLNFGTGSSVSAQSLGDTSEQSANALPVCICDCVYLKSEKIRNHNYFEPTAGNAENCSSIEGQACLGTHRGETFRGTVQLCQGAPRQVGTSASAVGTNWLNVKHTYPRQLSDGISIRP